MAANFFNHPFDKGRALRYAMCFLAALSVGLVDRVASFGVVFGRTTSVAFAQRCSPAQLIHNCTWRAIDGLGDLAQ